MIAADWVSTGRASARWFQGAVGGKKGRAQLEGAPEPEVPLELDPDDPVPEDPLEAAEPLAPALLPEPADPVPPVAPPMGAPLPHATSATWSGTMNVVAKERMRRKLKPVGRGVESLHAIEGLFAQVFPHRRSQEATCSTRVARVLVRPGRERQQLRDVR
jgi:hypothetical protein